MIGQNCQNLHFVLGLTKIIKCILPKLINYKKHMFYLIELNVIKQIKNFHMDIFLLSHSIVLGLFRYSWTE